MPPLMKLGAAPPSDFRSETDQKKIDALNDRNASQQKEMQKLRQQVKDLQKQMRKKDKEFRESRKETVSYEELNGERFRNQQLRASDAKLRAANEKLSATLQESQKELGELRAQLRRRDGEDSHRSLHTSNSPIQQSIDDNLIEDLRVSNSGLTRENAQLKDRLNAMEKVSRRTAAEYQISKTELNILQTQLERLQNKSPGGVVDDGALKRLCQKIHSMLDSHQHHWTQTMSHGQQQSSSTQQNLKPPHQTGGDDFSVSPSLSPLEQTPDSTRDEPISSNPPAVRMMNE